MSISVPQISVIICTRNRAPLLEKCLLSVKEQTLAKDAFEVLVVDNGSSDTTSSVLEKFSEQLSLTVIKEPIVGLSRARNTGWKAAKAEIVSFLDDDAMANPRWLAAALGSFKTVKPTPAALTGPIMLEWEQPAPEWLTIDIQGCLGLLDFGSVARKFGGLETLFGANCFFHRRVLERFNGFNERLGRFNTVLLSGEETLLQRQIENAGDLLWYEPEAGIRHWVPASRATPGWFYRRYYWGGVSDYFMNKILGRVSGSPEEQREKGRATRVFKNLLFSSGLASYSQVVHSRIYMCYVAGWFIGGVKWRRVQRTDLPEELYER